MRRIGFAMLVVLSPLTATAQAAPGPSEWGVLAELVGTSWGTEDETFDFQWKVPNERLAVTNLAGKQAAYIEYRRGADGRIKLYSRETAIGRIDLPKPDSWRQSSPSGTFVYECRRSGDVLACEQGTSGGRVTFTMKRLSPSEYAARLAVVDSHLELPDQPAPAPGKGGAAG